MKEKTMSFEQVIFQPCDKIHFDKTINQEIDLIEHRQFMTDKEYKDLNRIFPKGKARLWGVVDGKKIPILEKGRKYISEILYYFIIIFIITERLLNIVW